MNFMKVALEEAKKAFKINEVPIGAVIVKENRIIGSGYNLVETKQSSIYHAEIIAIKKAQKYLKNWRLSGCKIFVTVEPCVMCAGAIINSRIDEVIFGLKEEKFGAIVSKIRVFEAKFNHKVNFKFDNTFEKEIKTLMQDFFIRKRK